MARKPTLIIEGNDPNCVHYEILVGWIGACRKCGRVRQYYDLEEGENIYREKGRAGQEARKLHYLKKKELAVV